MKKKNVALLGALLLSPIMGFAQKAVISGVLKDSVQNSIEPYATIRVFKTDKPGTPISMGVTDAKGNIHQEIAGKGNYIIALSSVGKKEIRRKFSLNGETTLNLGTVYTTEDSKTLKGVEVVAQKPLVKMETDKMTYNVQNDIDAKASTVLDMLRKVPMVTVDGQDNISVNGSSNFKVYVNDKPNPMFSSNPSKIFKAMPASMVKNIEVVTNPGAKYDAEGTGGILNIVMNTDNGGNKTDMNGYNGSISASVSTRGERGSAFISGQQGKLTYSANAMYNHDTNNDLLIDVDRTQTDVSTTNYYKKSDNKNDFTMASISMGYEIDSLQNININANLNSWENKMDGYPTTAYKGGIYGDGFSYSNLMKQKTGNTSFNGSMDYQRFFNQKHSSYVILSYLFSTSPSHNKQTRNYSDEDIKSAPIELKNLYSNDHGKSTEHTLQADFTSALSETQKLNYGAKYIARRNTSDSKYYDVVDGEQILNETNSVNYKNTQSILAGYGEWKSTFGKWGSVAGLRYEHTFEKITFENTPEQNFKKDYGTLVPNISLTYNIAPTSNIGISYNMRIVRPGISYMSPYVDRTYPTSLSYGNPDIEVEKSHYIKLVFNYFSQKFMLNATLGQNFCNNQMSQYSFMDNNNMLNTTYGNIVKNRWTNLNIFANWLVFPKTRIMTSSSVDYGYMHSEQLKQENHGWQVNTYIGLEQTLPWDIKWSLGSVFSSKTYNLQGWNGGMSIGFTTLTKSFLNDKLNIALRFVSPYSNTLDIKQYSAGTDFVQNMRIKVPIRQIGITATWNFGNTKKQFQQRKSNISNDFSEKESKGQQISNTGNNM